MKTANKLFVTRLGTSLLLTLLSHPATIVGAVPAAYFTAARSDALVDNAARAADQDGLSVPWFDQLQIRASLDDSSESERSAAARLQIKTPRQYGAEKAILRLQARRNNLTESLAFDTELQDRYQQLIDLFQYQHQQHLAIRRQHLAERETSAQRAAAGSSDFRPGELQRAELRLSAARRQLSIDSSRLQRTRSRLAALLPENGADAVTVDGFITVEDLPPISVQHAEDRGAHNPAMTVAHLDADIARQALTRERGRNGFGLRFVELRHRTDDSNSGSDNRVTIGFDIPLGRSFASSKRLLQHNEANYRLHRLHLSQQRELRQYEDQMSLLLDEYQLQQQGLADISARLARHNRSTPAVLTLALQRQQLDLREKLVQQQAEIYRHYIDALALTGQLSAEPLRNWLASGQPVL